MNETKRPCSVRTRARTMTVGEVWGNGPARIAVDAARRLRAPELRRRSAGFSQLPTAVGVHGAGRSAPAATVCGVVAVARAAGVARPRQPPDRALAASPADLRPVVRGIRLRASTCSG